MAVQPASRISSGAATDLAEARQALLAVAPDRLPAIELRAQWHELHESWLTRKATEIGIIAGSGLSLVAIGSHARRQLLPYSDLDLLLLHDGKPAEAIGPVAESLWYPLWDANIRLDHSVRTVAGALQVADAEISTALAILDARHVAGDERLSAQLVDSARQRWRRGIGARFGELLDATRARWRRSGEIAHRAQPDLKHGRGGLRDVQLLDALALAQLTDPITVDASDLLATGYRTLLDVRTELHRAAGRGHDLLLAQHADEIGAALRIGDRYDLARTLSGTARTIGYRVDAGLRTAANALPRRGIGALRPRPRRPLTDDVVEYNGEVVLARDARPDRDPGLVLRVAAAAATAELPIAVATLNRLAAAPALAEPWPRESLEDLLVLLSAGPALLDTVEALDRCGLWAGLFPEWDAVRDLPPRDVVHVWTVDRHLVETVRQAQAFLTRVARPDLLLLAALLHDVGKGRGVDHSVLGAELAAGVANRVGLTPADGQLLAKLVGKHLLLSKVACRYDLNDPRTLATVTDAVAGDPALLDVLHALTEADARATGPAVWSAWKASLVDDLVRRCHQVLAGEPLPRPDTVDPEGLALAARDEVRVVLQPTGDRHSYRAVMIAPDQRGMLSKAAAVLTRNGLRVQSASVNNHDGVAIDDFVVSPQFGDPPDPALLRQELRGALNGTIDVLGGLARSDGDARPDRFGEVPPGVPGQLASAPPRIRWFDGAPDRLIVEVRTIDRPALLARLTAAVEHAGGDIVWAKVTTSGSVVDDVFCVVAPERTVVAGWRAAMERELLVALAA